MSGWDEGEVGWWVRERGNLNTHLHQTHENRRELVSGIASMMSSLHVSDW